MACCEHYKDDITPAYNGWQEGPFALSPNNKVAAGRPPTGLVHQSRPVPVSDSHAVDTSVTVYLNVKCSQL